MRKEAISFIAKTLIGLILIGGALREAIGALLFIPVYIFLVIHNFVFRMDLVLIITNSHRKGGMPLLKIKAFTHFIKQRNNG